LGFSNFRFNDNLDNIPSIIKAFTRRSNFLLSAPASALFFDLMRPSSWLPTVSYTFDRTHQFAELVPTNSDFKAPQIPDQVSTNQNFAAQWQMRGWSFAYTFNHSFQDNRSDREGVPTLSTLGNVVHGFTLGVAPARSLDLNLNLSRENLNSKDSNANKDKNRDDTALRVGVSVNWRTTMNSAFAASLSNNLGRSVADLSQTSNSRDTMFDLQWSYRFAMEKSRMKKFQAQFFIRYANRYARSSSGLFRIDSLTKSQTLSAGMSFTFF
jgi:hypothetical protein